MLSMFFLFLLFLIWLTTSLTLKLFYKNGVNFLPEFFTISLSQIGTVYTLSLGVALFFLPFAGRWYSTILVNPGY